ncbi:MAG: hypothetical protein K2X11_13190, partial [Acetobacteraceae bacterium]|nr:hypothetical protein [Acetobacteraceae bacterium]
MRFAPLLLLLAAPTSLLAQGQDAQTAAMAPQTQARPAPLGSLSSVSVPGGRPIELAPVDWLRPPRADGLVLPGPMRLAAPERLACDAIAHDLARRACEGRSAPPAPPRGGEG